jgi:hypothetical protein
MWPTGSGSFATCSRPSAICSIDLSLTVRRSMNAASLPAARAESTSAAFSETSFFDSRRNAAAAASSARFFVSASARAT